MASVKLAYMPQQENNRVFSQYSPADPPSRSNSAIGSGIWSSAPPATPQSSSSSFLGSAWASPLAMPTPATPSAYGAAPPAASANTSGAYPPGTKLLADLTVGSEPVAATDRISPGPTSISAYPSTQSLSSASSRLSSRHNSQTEAKSPLVPSPTAAPSVLAPTGGSPNTSASDEIINTAIVVKNIPFAIKKEQLIDFMTQLGLPLPYAFNYHFDNGVFRGLAFANFTTADETAAVISTLNGRELGGRRLRVEYKKMLPFQERERIEREKRERRGQLEEQHQQGNGANAGNVAANASAPSTAPATPPHGQVHGHAATHAHASVSGAAAQTNSAPQAPKADLNDPETLQMYSSLLVFKHDLTRSELIIAYGPASSLNANQTYILGTLCRLLDLNMVLTEEQDIVISKPVADAHAKSENGTESPSYLSGALAGAIATPAAATLSRVNPAAIGSTQNITALSALNRWNSVNNLSSLAGGNVGSSVVAPGVQMMPQSWATGAGAAKSPAASNGGDTGSRAKFYDTVFHHGAASGVDRRH